MIEMYYVRIIDQNRYFLKDDFVEELTPTTIETPCTEGFYKPKWNGTEWIEGLTTDEINAIKNVVQPKTEMELLQEQILETQRLIIDMQVNL